MASWFAIKSSITKLGGTVLGDYQLRSEEHTSELQSHVNLVCRLLLEKKKKKILSERIQLHQSYSSVPTVATSRINLLIVATHCFNQMRLLVPNKKQIELYL